MTTTGNRPARVLDVLLKATDYFKSKGRESPRLAAEVLLGAVLGCDRLGVYMRFEDALTDEQLDRYRDLVRRRGKGEPVAYLTGEKEFHSLPFRVGPGVLVPRPETEILVDIVAEEIQKRQVAEPIVLDLGTGSGCILISVAREILRGRYVGLECSPEALVIARGNAEILGGGLDISILEGDWFHAVEDFSDGFDVIVSNPPYIPTGDIEDLQPEVSVYEPREALDGGPDGLDAYRKIAAGSDTFLRPGGFIALELGAGQADAVRGIFERTGYAGETRKDLGGKERVIIFEKKG